MQEGPGGTDPVVVADASARVRAIVAALPGVEVREGQHLAFSVRGRRFMYFLDDHHGDGRIALACKAPPGTLGFLVDQDPGRYFVPAYLGARGWVGVRLEPDFADWAQVELIIQDAYRVVAPKAGRGHHGGAGV